MNYTPDLKQAQSFLEKVAGSNGKFSFQTFPDPKSLKGNKKLTRVLHGTLDEHASELTRLNQQGAGIFVTINETDLRGRSAENIISLRSLFIDKDDGSHPLSKIPFSLRVATKRGEHGYYLLKPGEDLKKFTPAQKTLIYHHKTDEHIHDLPRVMRLPGFWHCKDPQSPFLVKLIEANDCRYTIDEILKHYPQLPERESGLEFVSQNIQLTTPTLEFLNWFDKLPVKEHFRNSTVVKIVREGLGQGYTYELLENLVQEYCRRAELDLPNTEFTLTEAREILNRHIKEHAKKPFKSYLFEWQEPVPFRECFPPPLPIDLPPSWFSEFVKAVAKSTQTPTDLPLMFGLAALSTCTARLFRVKVKSEYNEPCNIWTVACLESGNRKTAAFKLCIEPLLEWERDEAEKIKPIRIEAESKRKTQEARIAALRNKIAQNKDSTEKQKQEAELIELEKNLTVVPSFPRLHTTDVTPEELAALMNENNERMALLDDEGGIFDNIAGKYSSGVPNLEIYLKGHAGSSYRVDRKTRSTIFLKDPAVTIGVSPQPGVIKKLAKIPEFQDKGFIARFLYAMPKSNLGTREWETPPIGEEILCNYRLKLRSLLGIKPQLDSEGRIVPFTLILDETASIAVKEFFKLLEPALPKEMTAMKYWASKLVGASLRIAGILHVAQNIANAHINNRITLDTMAASINLAIAFIPHAKATFELMEVEPDIENAEQVLIWIQRKKVSNFTKSDCFKALQSRFKKVDYLEKPLSILVERHYIRKLPKEFVPYRPSEKYDVSPFVLEKTAEI